MKVERWPQLAKERWAFLKKVASGISGKYCEVAPGWIPRSECVAPHRHFSRIYIPSHCIGPFLNGVLAHELFHVMDSAPAAFSGIAWGVFLIANALEDARVEHQLGARWPGLLRVIDELNRSMLQFFLRERGRAGSTDSLKIYEVGLALYSLLRGLSENLIQRMVSFMALETARELLELAKSALTARDSFEVVEIAKKVMEEMIRAAERAAARTGSPSSESWLSKLRSEVQKAMSQTVEEVFMALGKTRWSSEWWGPFWRGTGPGYTFFPTSWTWEIEEAPLLSAPSARELEELLEEADPTQEKMHRKRGLHGQLLMTPQELVSAALGRERRVFLLAEEKRVPLLPGLLANLEVLIFVEAHSRYTESQAQLLKESVAALARLFSLVDCPLLVVRAFTCFRKNELVEDPQTKRVWERWTDEFSLMICTLKSPEKPWDERAEKLLSTLPLGGCNNPLEGYPRLRSWELKLPASSRPRVYICIGAADHINVVLGSLKYATEPLRKGREKAIYVNVGDEVPEYSDSSRKEFAEAFDAFVQGSAVQELVVKVLHALLELMA
jgi:hypothetical protein